MIRVFSSAKSYSGISKLRGAGPFRARPATQHQSHYPRDGHKEGGYKYHNEIHDKDRTIPQSRPTRLAYQQRSAEGSLLPMGTHPRWVQTPSMTSHSGFLTRSESFWGSRRVDISTSFASSISSCERCRINTGYNQYPQLSWIRIVLFHAIYQSIPSHNRGITWWLNSLPLQFWLNQPLLLPWQGH